MTTSPFALLLSDDLLFSSRITATARAQNLEMKTVRTAKDLAMAAAARHPSCVILDVHQPGLDFAALSAELKRDGPCTLVGYGSHVAADLLRKARAEGCDVVMPNSQFVEKLAEMLPEWVIQPESSNAD